MIESILTRLNSIPADKVMHFATGAVLCAALLPWFGPAYALALTMIVGFLKELYDAFHKDTHTPDVWDALATSAGGCLIFFSVSW